MVNWNDILIEIATKIAEHVDFYEDLENLAKVSSLWRSASKIVNKPQERGAPWLMLSARPQFSDCLFYSLYDHKIHCISIPILISTCIKDNVNVENLKYFSSWGWLVCVSEIDLKVYLFHPLAGRIIKLPDLPSCRSSEQTIEKILLSESPLVTDDYSIAIKAKGVHIHWSNKRHGWIILPHYQQCHVIDVSLYKGKIYVVSIENNALFVDYKIDKYFIPVRFFHNDLPNFMSGNWTLHLVESHGSLLLVFCDFRSRFSYKDVVVDRERVTFKVLELDVETQKIKAVESLGERALFVSRRSSFSVDSSDCCKGNCIYYCHDPTDSKMELDSHIYSEMISVFDFTSGKKVDSIGINGNTYSRQPLIV